MQPAPDDTDQARDPRLLPVAGALAAAAAAASLAFWPEITATTLARITGVGLVAMGLLRAYEAIRALSTDPRSVVAAVTAVGLGAALLVWPDSTLLVATVLIGVWLIVDGLGRVFGTALDTSPRDEVIGNLLGLGESLVGVMVIARPVAGARAAALFVAVGLVLHAFGRILDALAARRRVVTD